MNEAKNTNARPPSGAERKKTDNRRKRRLSDIFDTVYLKGVLIGAVLSAVLLGLVYYVCWHVTGGFEGAVEVTPALRATAEVRYDAVGYMFRDETVLYSQYSGAINAVRADGERVGAGELLLTAYREADVDNVTGRLKEIDARISVLERSSVGENVSVSYTKALENSMSVKLEQVRAALAAGEYAKARALSDELLVLLNRKNLVFSSEHGYTAQLDALKAEKATLSSRLTGERGRVYAPYAGYFYSSCDGGESLYTLKNLEAITPTALDTLIASRAESVDGRTAVGKISASRKWYLVVETETSSLAEYYVGKEYELEFTDCGGLELDMLLQRTVEEGERALLVFESDKLPEDLDMVRMHNVSIKLKTYSGIRVPVSAIRFVDGREGVYAMFGNTVLFRVIDVIGTVDGYAYVSENGEPVTVMAEAKDKDGNVYEKEVVLFGALRLYDSIITSGTGLYHGMIID